VSSRYPVARIRSALAAAEAAISRAEVAREAAWDRYAEAEHVYEDAEAAAGDSDDSDLRGAAEDAWRAKEDAAARAEAAEDALSAALAHRRRLHDPEYWQSVAEREGMQPPARFGDLL
jgi:hypothetical protein